MKPIDKATNYKPADDREKDLRLALYRIQKGRTRSGKPRLRSPQSPAKQAYQRR